MGAPIPGMEPAGQPAAEALLDAFKTLDASEKSKHAAVLDYWLSIRGDRDLPPLRDLNPLEISDAGPSSILLELIGGGEDAEIRHMGERLRNGADIERIAEAARPSILACIAKKLSICAISRNLLSFEDEFSKAGATTRCWVTLLPLSSAGAWVDYVYAFVSFEAVVGEKAAVEEIADEASSELDESTAIPAVDVLELDEPVEMAEEIVHEPEAPEVAAEAEPEIAEAEESDPEIVEADEPEASEPEVAQVEEIAQAPEVQEVGAQETAEEAPAAEPPVSKTASKNAGFSFDSITAAAGFYGTKAGKIAPAMPIASAKAAPANEQASEPTEQTVEIPQQDEEIVPVAEEVSAAAEEELQTEPTRVSEGTLQSKLTEVRAKADEARMAKLRSNAALYEGLSAAYDFAIDAEDSPEEYLKLVEEKGLKIKLRSPMTPVVKLAFDGMCDDATLAQLEAVLAWALKQELPRGTLAQRIEEEGGIGPILNGLAKAA